MTRDRGRLVTLEGVEGAGKTSALAAIQERLKAHGIAAAFTREPGGTALGESIRETLLRGDEAASMTPDTELLLVFAGRAQHLSEVIEPALDRGEWVVCDRFTDASYAYQGFGRGIPTSWIATLEERIQQGLTPDLTLLLDVGVSAGRARARGAGTPDRFEREADDFFERVRAGYEQRRGLSPERFRRIDAERPEASVRSEVAHCIDELIARG